MTSHLFQDLCSNTPKRQHGKNIHPPHLSGIGHVFSWFKSLWGRSSAEPESFYGGRGRTWRLLDVVFSKGCWSCLWLLGSMILHLDHSNCWNSSKEIDWWILWWLKSLRIKIKPLLLFSRISIITSVDRPSAKITLECRNGIDANWAKRNLSRW